MKFLSQSQQAGNFWLINVQLDSDTPLPYGYAIRVNNMGSTPDVEWVLFSQTKNQASFLAKTEFINHHSTKSFNFETLKPPPWCFLEKNQAFFSTNKTYLLLASDLYMAAAFHLLKDLKDKYNFVILLHATEEFPCIVKPAQIMFHQFPHEAIGSCPLLEDWKLVNRLCSNQGLAGCFDGDFKQLFNIWTPPTDWEILSFE